MAKKTKKDYLDSIPLVNDGSLDNTSGDFSSAPTVSPDVENLMYSIPEIKHEGMFKDQSMYDEGISYQKATSDQGIASYRHENQPWTASLGAMLNQAVVGEIIGGTIEGTGYLLDLPQYANLAKGTEQEFGNWFSDAGKDLKQWTREGTPVYSDPEKRGEFSPEDWTWWMEHAPSIASSVSLMIPATGATKALGMIGKMTKIGTNVGKNSKWAMTGISSAVMSRHMENMMEASSVSEELNNLAGKAVDQYQADEIYKNYGVKLDNKGFDEDGNPTYLIDEDLAKQIGARAAADVYKKDWAMLVQDIPQYLMLSKPFGSVTRNITTGMSNKLGQGASNAALSKSRDLGMVMLGEGFEEGYQYVVNERAKEMALADAGLIDKRELGDALSEYMGKGDIWTSAFFGALGAGAMQAAGKGIGALTNRIKGLESEDERRLRDMDSWSKKIQVYNDLMSAAEQSGSQELFNATRDQMVLDMGLNAAQNGNIGHMIDALESMSETSEEDKATFGITPEMTQEMQEKNPEFISKLTRLEELYQNNLDKHGPQFASLITRADMSVEAANEDLGKLDKEISETLGSIPNLNQLSNSGQSLFTLDSNINSMANVLNTMETEIAKAEKEGRDADAIDNMKKRSASLKEDLDSLIKDRSEIEYTSEDKAADKKIMLTSPALEKYNSLVNKRAFTQQTLNTAQEDAANTRDVKWQKKAEKKSQQIQEESAKDAVNDATTQEELNDVVNRAEGTPMEDLIEQDIETVAAEQAQDFSDFPSIEFTAEDIESMQQEQVPVSSFAATRYEGKPQLYSKEIPELKAHLNSLEKDEAIELALNELEAIENPQQLDSWIDSLKEMIDTGVNVTPVAEAINEYYTGVAQRVESEKKSKEAIQEANVTKSEVTNPTPKVNTVESGEQVSSDKFDLFHTGNKGLTVDAVSVDPRITRQDKKGRYGGFYAYDKMDKVAEFIRGNETEAIYGIRLKPGVEIKEYKGDIERLSGTKLQELRDQGYQVIRGKSLLGKEETIVVDKNAIESIVEIDQDGVALNSDQAVKPEQAPTNKQIIPDSVEYTINRSNGGKTLYISNNPNAQSVVAVNLPNYVPGLDVNGLNSGEYKVGQTIHIEVDSSNEYAPSQYENRAFRLVVYVDGNTNNKSAANRKVVGSLPRAVSVKDAAIASKLNNLRKVLHDNINLKTGAIRTSDYTTTVTGHKVDYSQVDVYNTPSNIITKEDQGSSEYKRIGGFSIGITTTENGERRVKFDKLNSTNKVYTDHNGQIIIGTNNPYAPETLQMRGFIKKLNEYAVTHPENAAKISNKVIEEFKKLNEDGSNYTEVKNEVNKYLYSDFKYDGKTNTLMLDNKYSISMQDLQAGNIDSLVGYINDLHFNIDKNLANTARVSVDLGFGFQTGPYNKLVNDFLKLNIKPNQYFEGTALLIDVNAKEQANIASESKNEEEAKVVVDEVVDNTKDVIVDSVANSVEEVTETTESTQVDSNQTNDVVPVPDKNTVIRDIAINKFNNYARKALDGGTQKEADAAEKDLVDFLNEHYDLFSDYLKKINVSKKDFISYATDPEDGNNSINDVFAHAKEKEVKRTRKRRGDINLGTSKNLLDDINEGKDLPKLRVADSSDVKFSNKEELEWLAKNFPSVPVRDLKEVSGKVKEVLKSGQEAWGAFYNASIYLAENAGVGTAYHEAFHVVFNLYLNDAQKSDILKDVSGRTALEKEEVLADQFADYIMAMQADTSLSKKINNFFRKLWIMIKSVFSDRINNVEELAFRSNIGFYSKPQVDFGKFGDQSIKTKVNGWSYRQTKMATNAINKHLLMNIVPALRKTNTHLTHLNDAELLSVVSKDKGYLYVYQLVHDDFLDIAESLEGEQADALFGIVDNLFDEEGNPGRLLNDAIRSLDYNNGIKVSMSEVKDTENDTVEQADDLENEESLKENWMTEFTQRSAKNNAPYEIKNFIRYMKTGNADKFFGLPEYVNYDDAYNGLLANLSGSTSLVEMKTILSRMIGFNPEYQQILTKLESDPVFAAKFFNTFSVTHTKYSILIKKGNRYILTDSNRRGIVKSIVTDWTNSVLVDSKVVISNLDGTYVVNVDEAKSIKERFDIIAAKKELTSEDITELNGLMKDLGLDIPESVFNYVNEAGFNHKFLTGQWSITTIVNKFAEGKNPFDSEAGLDTSEANSINHIARVVKSAMPQLFESSFKNIDGQTQYAHLVPSFLSKIVNRLHRADTAEGLIDEYQQDPIFINNPILNELSNLLREPELLKETFDYSLVDGISDNGRRSYPNMNKADMQTMSLNAYFNNGNKKYSNYRGPVFSDAGNMILFKFKRYGIDAVINNMIDIGGSEYTRIQNNSNNDLGIKNYHSDTNSSTETGYHIMPMFNGFEGNPAENRDAAAKAVEKWMKGKIAEYKKSLIESGVIAVVDGKVVPKDSRLDERVENLTAFIEDFYYNDFLMRASFGTLTIGDPAFYKNDPGKTSKVVDYTKRAKEILSPKMVPDVTSRYVSPSGEIVEVNTNYNTMYLKDAEITAPSLEGIVKTVDSLVEQGVLNKDQARVIKTAYTEVNQTDAQAYITLPFYRETMVSFGRWTDKHQSAYGRLMDGQGTADDIALIMQPLKPFMYTQIWNSELKAMVPVQNKNSEYLLLPQFINDNKALKDIHDHMLKNNIGVVNFDSAVKAGLYGAVPVLDKDGNVDMSKLNEAVIHSIPMEDRGIQMETPEHFKDSENLFGTQIRKLIMADLVEGVDYNIDGAVSKNAKDLYDTYESIIMADLEESYGKAEGEFMLDGEFNWKKVHELLLDEARSRGKGEEFEKAIEYDEANDRIRLPLFHPLYASAAESLLTSVFKNRVTKQKIAGGAFVQATSFGLSHELKLVFNEDGGLNYGEVMLPAWSKRFYQDFVNEDGTLDFEQFAKSAPELLDMVGYRIPTEDKYSMLPLKVVGFLPLEAGGAIMLPAEITTISGSDFDVDKMFVMMKEGIRKDAINDIAKELKGKIKSSLDSYNKQNPDSKIKPNIKIDNIKTVLEMIYNGTEVEAKDDLVIKKFYDKYKDELGELVKYEAVKYDYNKEASKNNKKARNNAKIDIIRSVLRNKHTVGSLMTPGGFDYLQSLSNIIQGKLAGTGLDMSVFDVSTIDEMSFRNMTGKQLVGIAANHNAHHALRQHFDLSLVDPIRFDGKELGVLGRNEAVTQFEVSKKGVTKVDVYKNISRNLSEYLAAVVDNAKDPVAAFVNYNTYTADVMSLIVSLGYDPATAVFFASQPIIRELTNRVMSEKNTPESTIVNKLAESIGIKNISKSEAVDISTDKLFKALGTEDLNTGLQADVLIAFVKYNKMGKDLGKLIRASRADTKGMGSSMADAESLMSLINDISNKESFSINGVSEMFSGGNFITSFTDNGVIKPMQNVMEKIFPYNNTFYNNIKESINKFIKNRELSVDQRNNINRQVMSFYLSGFDFFDVSEKESIVKDLPKRFFDYLNENPEMKSNSLYKRLKFEAFDERIPIDRLIFSNTGAMTDEQRVDIQNAWSDLLNVNKSNPVDVEMARDLIKYTYFTSGLNFTANSFAHMIPVGAYLTDIIDSNGRTMNDYLYRLMDMNSNSIEIQNYANSFMDQFYRNNYKNTQYVPRINEDNTNINKISGSIEETDVILISPEIKDDSLIIKENKMNIPIPFIAKDLEKSTILFKFMGYNSSGELIYTKTNKLGIPNYVVEYNISAIEMESDFAVNSVDLVSAAQTVRNTSDIVNDSMDKDAENYVDQMKNIPNKKDAEDNENICLGTL